MPTVGVPARRLLPLRLRPSPSPRRPCRSPQSDLSVRSPLQLRVMEIPLSTGTQVCFSHFCSFFGFAALALTLIDDYQWIPWSCKLKVATVQRTNAQEYPHTRPHSLYLTDLPPLSMSLVPLPPFRPVKVRKRRPYRPHPPLAGLV